MQTFLINNIDICQNFGLCYFDYMGTVVGNASCKPLFDLKIFLGNATGKVIVGMTFANRNRWGIHVPGCTNSKEQNRHYVGLIFLESGYEIIMEHVSSYRKHKRTQGMTFMAFTAQKIKASSAAIPYPYYDGEYIGLPSECEEECEKMGLTFILSRQNIAKTWSWK
jgi:hypothetical protein